MKTILLTAAAALALPAAAHAQDLFDVANGASVTAHSPLFNAGEDPNEIIGAVPTTGAEHGNLIFSDTGTAGTVHFVEFQTPAPVSVALVRLAALADSCTSDRRVINNFRLLAHDGAGFQEILNTPVSVPYNYLASCQNALIVSGGVPTTVSDLFRAEFTQATSSTFDGPRIVELDGFGPPVCGDVNKDGQITATDALNALRSAVGSIFCDGCVCDVNDDAANTATDGLNILQQAVGQPVVFACPVCALTVG